MSGLASLALLEGVWRLDRRIVHDDGRQNRFEGTATFTKTGPRFLEDEDGLFHPGQSAQPLRATRRYFWGQTGDQVEVSFADMRPFHCFALGVSTPSATHLCPPDRYEVAYDFSAFPAWRAVWRVEGPRKAYEMTSVFSRGPA